MAQNNEQEIESIDLKVRIIPDHSIIDLNIPRERSTEKVMKHINFLANAHLHKQLGPGTPLVNSFSYISFEPPVGPDTRYCDLANDKVITTYAVVDTSDPTVMTRFREYEAGKENRQPGAAPNTSKSPDHSAPIHLSTSSPTPQPSHDDLFKMIKALQADAAAAQAQRKQDTEAAQAQIKEVEERAEAKRKKAAEVAQAQRKQDAEAAQAQIKEVEERAEAKRKKAAERAEAQRKTDIANAKSENLKLKTKVQELNDKIQQLEQRSKDRALERKQKDEATQRYINSLAKDIEATTDFLAVGDEAALDRIKRRNLLDRAQSLLAEHLGLLNEESFPSLSFREALGPSSNIEERCQRLSELLKEKKDKIPSQAALLLTKPAALKLLAERFPKVRLDGDQVAHGHRQRSWYEGSISRAVGTAKVAMMDLLDFVLSVVGE